MKKHGTVERQARQSLGALIQHPALLKAVRHLYFCTLKKDLHGMLRTLHGMLRTPHRLRYRHTPGSAVGSVRNTCCFGRISERRGSISQWRGAGGTPRVARATKSCPRAPQHHHPCPASPPVSTHHGLFRKGNQTDRAEHLC